MINFFIAFLIVATITYFLHRQFIFTLKLIAIILAVVSTTLIVGVLSYQYWTSGFSGIIVVVLVIVVLIPFLNLLNLILCFFVVEKMSDALQGKFNKSLSILIIWLAVLLSAYLYADYIGPQWMFLSDFLGGFWAVLAVAWVLAVMILHVSMLVYAFRGNDRRRYLFVLLFLPVAGPAICLLFLYRNSMKG